VTDDRDDSFGMGLRRACERLAARPLLGYLLLAVLAFALYAAAIPNEFVFDDNSTLRKNPIVREPSRWLELFTEPSHGYRPVRYLSFMLDYAIGGDSPWIYHVMNALYHGVACFLVWRLLLRLSGDARAALAGALLFLAHPAHTECVAYISGRRDILTSLFYVGAFLAFLRWREAPGAGPLSGIGWAALSTASLALALGAKEMAVTFPVMVVLYELIFDRKAFVRHLPLYALGAALAGFVVWKTLQNNISGQRVPWGGSWDVQHMTATALLGHYARLCLFPARLLADYSIDAFPLVRSPSAPAFLAAVATLGSALAIAIAALRRAPLVTFGIAWFFLALTPVAQIVPYHEIGADHYLYLPSVGACLVLGLGFATLWDRRGARAAAVILAVVLALFAGRTVVRIFDWRTAESIYRATIETAPRCARAHLNLGSVTASRPAKSNAERLQHHRRALPHYDRAIELDPGYVFAFVSRARLLRMLGAPEPARRDFERALEIAVALPVSPVHPLSILAELERWPDIIASLDATRARRPLGWREWRVLSRAREATGDLAGALEAQEKNVETSESPDAKELLRAGALAKRAGDLPKAVHYRDRALAILTPEQRRDLEAKARATRAPRVTFAPVGATSTAMPPPARPAPEAPPASADDGDPVTPDLDLAPP